MFDRRNIRLNLQYDGTNYFGWQIQPNKITIQNIIECVLSKILNQPIKLTSAARTDTGVHALEQIVNFHTDSRIKLKNLISAINSMIPSDIAVISITEMPEKFNARRDVISRRYRYRILNREYPSAFESRFSYHYRYPLDIDKMQKAGNYLVGTYDFTSFNGSPKLTKNPIRTITDLYIHKINDLIYIDIQANGFFHHMVRTIVGTMIEIGRGKMKYQKMQYILNSKDRKQAGCNVPPQGLFLMRVELKKEYAEISGIGIRKRIEFTGYY